MVTTGFHCLKKNLDIILKKCMWGFKAWNFTFYFTVTENVKVYRSNWKLVLGSEGFLRNLYTFHLSMSINPLSSSVKVPWYLTDVMKQYRTWGIWTHIGRLPPSFFCSSTNPQHPLKHIHTHTNSPKRAEKPLLHEKDDVLSIFGNLCLPRFS